MNLQESDILKTLLNEPFITQHILAESSGHSVGVVNRSLRNLMDEGYLIVVYDMLTEKIADCIGLDKDKGFELVR